MKLSLLIAVVCASLVSAKKKPKTTTTRIRFTGTPPKHSSEGWPADDAKTITCEQCKYICAVAPVPKWLDEYWRCIKWKCSWGNFCKPTDWGKFPKTTANATSTANSTSSATSNKKAASNKATSTTPTFITITSTTAPGPTSSMATISSTSSVAANAFTAKASTTTSSSSHRLPALRPNFITSMIVGEVEDE